MVAVAVWKAPARKLNKWGNRWPKNGFVAPRAAGAPTVAAMYAQCVCGCIARQEARAPRAIASGAREINVRGMVAKHSEVNSRERQYKECKERNSVRSQPVPPPPAAGTDTMRDGSDL